MTRRILLSNLSAVVVAAGTLAGPSLLSAQTPTPLKLEAGKVVEGTTGWDGPAIYHFQAEAAGVLTIVVRSLNESDLVLLVADTDGQPLPNGRSDQDLGGDPGAEQFAVSLPRAGEYQIRIETFRGASAPFKMGASWLPFPDLAVPPDPDGSPSSAVRIQIWQDTRRDSIDGSSGDYWDWFVLKAERSGTLTVATRADEGDLILEVFAPGAFSEAVERSDQDLQESGGNEALTLVVEAGEELYFRVSAFGQGASISYRLQVGFIPD